MRRNPGEDTAFYKMSKFDVVLIGLILFISVFFLGGKNRGHSLESHLSKTAFIYQKNTLLKKVNLQQDEIFPLLNGKMRIEVKNARLRVIDSDCPQHICMQTGWIQYGGQTIICVPNKVTIEIKAAAEPLIDAVAN